MNPLKHVAISMVFATTSILAEPVKVPKIWDDAALKDWALPIAALGVRPGHFTSAEYYAVPGENSRTYPVYHPDREPSGYWEWLKAQKPAPLVDAQKLRTKSDWIDAGRIAFRDLEHPLFRITDPAIIAKYRDPGAFENVFLQPDGTLIDRRWVVTAEGLALASTDCSGCHKRVLPDGTVEFAGPSGPLPAGKRIRPPGSGSVLQGFMRMFPGGTEQQMFRAHFTVPWAPDERVEQFLNAPADEVRRITFDHGPFVAARTNGSPFFATKIPDLQNIRYSRYIDATGTHRLRGPEDLARYAALVSAADPMDFGPHRILTDEQRKVRGRVADEVLYAIGVYLLSLEPPRNPRSAAKEALATGERIFRREGCINCHAPSGYTSGKLTLADGYTPPNGHPERDNILPVSVGTDPGLALKTRKGTGLYKIPSLRGLWYRPALLHDGSVGSLEEMFDPARLEPSHEPGGWKGPGVTKRAIPGHKFGIGLPVAEKQALLAFLRSL